MFRENERGPQENIEHHEKNPRRKLEKLMLEISREINQTLGLDLINPEGAIDMQTWTEASGRQDLEKDENFVKTREMEFSGLKNERVREYYREKYHAKTEEEMLGQFRKEREKQKGIIFEKAKTALFHKFAGEKFIVVHTARYDDYKNNVDNLMVNRETGDVVCAFDEVRAEGEDDEKLQNKIDKVKNLVQDGGTEIKYGFSFDKKPENKNNSLVLKKLTNIPTFYLSVTSKKLDELLEAMSDDPGATPSPTEQKIFQELVSSLRSQAKMLKGVKVPPVVRYHLRGFENSLIIMEKIARENNAA